jgi:hypothetical protein
MVGGDFPWTSHPVDGRWEWSDYLSTPVFCPTSRNAQGEVDGYPYPLIFVRCDSATGEWVVSASMFLPGPDGYAQGEKRVRDALSVDDDGHLIGTVKMRISNVHDGREVSCAVALTFSAPG